MTSILDTTGASAAPLDIVAAHGCTLLSRAGREYLDLEAGVWCTSLGHQHPAVTAAILRQVGAVSHLGYRSSASVVEEATRRLCEITGLADGRALLLSSGSEAVELGVRIAAAVTGRSLFVRLGDGYLSAYGAGGVPGGGRWITTDELDALDGDALDETLRQVAGFVLEPGNASGLVRLPDAAHVRRVVERVRGAGGLVVVDEVTTGFGRTGTWFGFEHVGLTPDVVAVGKGCGNGYPVSAVVVSRDVATRIAGSGLRYAQSHQNDPLGAAVVLAVIETIEADGLLAAARDRGAELVDGLERIAARASSLGEVRGRGLMCAFDVTVGGAPALQTALLERGYLVGANAARDVIRVYPPLVVTAAELAGFLAALDDCVRA